MRANVTTQEREFYMDNGYLVMEEFLDPSELERLADGSGQRCAAARRPTFLLRDQARWRGQSEPRSQRTAGLLRSRVHAESQPLADQRRGT